MANASSLEDASSSPGFSMRDAIITGCVVGGMLLIIFIILLVACCKIRLEKRRKRILAKKQKQLGSSTDSNQDENPRYNTTTSILPSVSVTSEDDVNLTEETLVENDERMHETLNMDVPIPLTRRLSGYSNRDSTHDVEPVKFETAASLTQKVTAYKLDERRLKRQDVIGRSSCGIVYKGKLYDNSLNHSQQVQIKSIHGGHVCVNEMVNFLDDITLLRGFKHPRILQFLGLVIQNDQPFSLNPYPDNGILYTFVTTPHQHFTVKELLRMALQVGEGMNYLSYEGLVHKDLATRNCVVDKNRNVLIADNALARSMFDLDYELIPELDERPLPLRWMAYESVSRKEYSSKSDIWSYGVLLWEMMTRCEIPYADQLDAAAVISSIKTGKYPERPPVCPDRVYELMEECWVQDPALRPNFAHLCKEIEILLGGKMQPKKYTKGTKAQYLRVLKDGAL